VTIEEIRRTRIFRFGRSRIAAAFTTAASTGVAATTTTAANDHRGSMAKRRDAVGRRIIRRIAVSGDGRCV